MWDGQDGFDFLGMHHRYIAAKTREAKTYYTLYQFPSRKAMKNMKAVIKQVLSSRTLLLNMDVLIDRLNPKIRGWRNYYGLGTAQKWLNKVEWYINEKFTIWYNKKRRCRCHRTAIYKVKTLLRSKGLIELAGVTHAEGEECRKAG